jgi:chlorobactene glucosyltransferase
MSSLAWVLFAWVPAVPFGMTLLNLLTWRRGTLRCDYSPRVSVLVPARNEAATIDTCVRAIAASSYPLHEILVCDDQSSDGTLPILRALEREFSQLRVLVGLPLPAGWVGKPHACDQLARHASGELLVFVDADTQLEAHGVQRMLSFMGPGRADVVSAVPLQVMSSFAERVLLPLLLLTYTSWLPLFLVQKSRDPRFVAANGQLLAVRRDVYTRLGGFAAVASEIVDDLAFCRHAKAHGATLAFADGSAMARCRMYRSLRGIWDGFSKNLYEGLGATPYALVSAVLLYLSAFVLPYVALSAALLGPAELSTFLFWPALTGVLLNSALRAALVLRFAQPPEGILLHPLSVILLCVLALNSYRWSARGCLTWAGRSYADRKQRLTVGT